MDLSHRVESWAWAGAMKVESWSGFWSGIYSWTGVGSDSPVRCQCLLLQGTFVLFRLFLLPCVAHIRQSRFEYLFHNQ